MFTFGLYPLINKPTRVTSYSATLTDNIFTNNFSSDNISGILCNDITDHLPIFCSCYHRSLSRASVPKLKSFTVINGANIDNFKKELSEMNWVSVLKEQDVNVAYNLFVEKFKKCHDKHFPLKRVDVNKKSVNKPWLTKGHINVCREYENRRSVGPGPTNIRPDRQIFKLVGPAD